MLSPTPHPIWMLHIQRRPDSVEQAPAWMTQAHCYSSGTQPPLLHNGSSLQPLAVGPVSLDAGLAPLLHAWCPQAESPVNQNLGWPRPSPALRSPRLQGQKCSILCGACCIRAGCLGCISSPIQTTMMCLLLKEECLMWMGPASTSKGCRQAAQRGAGLMTQKQDRQLLGFFNWYKSIIPNARYKGGIVPPRMPVWGPASLHPALASG